MRMNDVRNRLNNPDDGVVVEILSDKGDRIDAKITAKGKTMRVAFMAQKDGSVKQHVY